MPWIWYVNIASWISQRNPLWRGWIWMVSPKIFMSKSFGIICTPKKWMAFFGGQIPWKLKNGGRPPGQRIQKATQKMAMEIVDLWKNGNFPQQKVSWPEGEFGWFGGSIWRNHSSNEETGLGHMLGKLVVCSKAPSKFGGWSDPNYGCIQHQSSGAFSGISMK